MINSNHLKKPFGLVLFCSAIVFPFTAHATTQDEIMTAAEHAGLSGASSNLEMAHAHLHHALNCLVGPSGKGYDSSAFDPCKGKGNGAIPDAGSKAQKHSLETVAKTVRKGLASNDLKAVQKDAMQVEAKLKAMEMK